MDGSESYYIGYDYDLDGIRTKKSVTVDSTGATTTHEYITQNGKVVRETIGSGTATRVFDFIYDENGRPFACKYTINGTTTATMYYVLNLQGDVVRILNANGSTLVKYSYNAWGEVISVTDGNDVPITNASHIGNLNPLRYRGYYYDTETGFYYVSSRYYDPEIGRWINADSVIAGVGGESLGYNMFAYCMNNPVNMTDSSGNWPTWSDVISVAKKTVDVIVQAAVFLQSPVINTVIKELHYGRNVLNNTSYTEKELVEQGYIKEDDSSDKFHQNNQMNDERNRKYVIGDWFSSEIVYYSDGTINTTPEDVGTFNVYSGDNGVLNIILHGCFDVIPYMIWGNSRDDSTTLVDRIIMIGE